MNKLAGAVTMAIVEEFGPGEMLRRLSDPWWFQAFSCVLGFDWHSSGVTAVIGGQFSHQKKPVRNQTHDATSPEGRQRLLNRNSSSRPN